MFSIKNTYLILTVNNMKCDYLPISFYVSYENNPLKDKYELTYPSSNYPRIFGFGL